MNEEGWRSEWDKWMIESRDGRLIMGCVMVFFSVCASVTCINSDLKPFCTTIIIDPIIQRNFQKEKEIIGKKSVTELWSLGSLLWVFRIYVS